MLGTYTFQNEFFFEIAWTQISTWTEPETLYEKKNYNGLLFTTSNEYIWPQKFSIFMHGLKSAILAIFQRGLGWPCPVSAALKNASWHLKNSLRFGANECLDRMEGKIRKCLFFHVKIF